MGTRSDIEEFDRIEAALSDLFHHPKPDPNFVRLLKQQLIARGPAVSAGGHRQLVWLQSLKQAVRAFALGSVIVLMVLMLNWTLNNLIPGRFTGGGPSETTTPSATGTTQLELTSTPLPSSTPTQTSAPTPGLPGEPVLLPAPDGRWTAILNLQAGSLELEDSQGVKHAIFPAGSTVNDARWSTNGKHLAVALTNLPGDWQFSQEAKTPPEIQVVEIDGSDFTKAESNYQAASEAAGGRFILGAWSPDNLRLLFWLGSPSASLQVDGLPLWVLDTKSMQATQLSETTLINPSYQSWSPGGSVLVFTNGGYRSAQVNKWLSIYEVDSGQVRTLIPEDELVPGQVAWSPAGEAIAFAAVEAVQTGDEWADWMGWDNPAIQARRIYLLDPSSGQYWRLNATEAYQDAPRWRADGKMLYYVQIDGDQAVLMAADPASGETQSLPGCLAPLPSGAGYYGQVDWTSLYENCPDVPTIAIPASEAAEPPNTAQPTPVQPNVTFEGLAGLHKPGR
jgi:hypothetical protein